MSAYCSSDTFVFKIDQRLVGRLRVSEITTDRITLVLDPPTAHRGFELFGFLDANNVPLPETVSQGVPDEERFTFEIWPWSRNERAAYPGEMEDTGTPMRRGQ